MFITVVKKGLACCLIAQVVLAGIVRAENEMTDSVAEADSLTSTVAKAPVNTPQYLMRGIEVVGDKVGRDIQDLPTSAAVVDESRMEDEPIATIDDVLNRVANVNSEGMAAMGGLFSIRGINQGSIFASFDATNQLAAVYLNQVALGGLLSQYIKPSTWDVRSVEVLRGPQSTLQGKNSLAGAVFFNYNRPDFTFDGGFRAEYGELDTWNLALYQNVPIEDDVLAARIALETRNSDGGIVNPITGADDIALIDEKTARLQLLYQPFGNEDISFNLTGIYFDSETNTQPRATEFGMYDLEDRLNEETWPGYVPQESWFTALESDFRLDDNWRIAAVTGYSDLKITGYKYDGDQMAPDLLWVNGDFDESQFSQDLRLHYEGGRFRGLLGGYYSKADVRTVYDADGFFTS
ncbi:MAG: TonB-dependent receptor plug domain-containing protein, partial [Chlorobiales bacterium]|nr:TonB-dependent receptor plug domain-containing protein [Chlorobiales bacterium]